MQSQQRGCDWELQAANYHAVQCLLLVERLSSEDNVCRLLPEGVKGKRLRSATKTSDEQQLEQALPACCSIQALPDQSIVQHLTA